MVKTTEENVSTKLQIPVDWKSLFDGTRKREIEYFIPGIAPMGAVTCIYGGAKQGKSLFVLNAVINVVLEKKFLGGQCQGRRVAYLDFENSAALHVKTRIEDMGFARHDLDDLVYFEHQWFDDFDSQKGGQQLLKLIVGHWDAIENGVHRVRDVTLGEDACRVARPKAARNRVTLCRCGQSKIKPLCDGTHAEAGFREG